MPNFATSPPSTLAENLMSEEEGVVLPSGSIHAANPHAVTIGFRADLINFGNIVSTSTNHCGVSVTSASFYIEDFGTIIGRKSAIASSSAPNDVFGSQTIFNAGTLTPRLAPLGRPG